LTYDDVVHFLLVLRMQSALGVKGDILEIGAYYGRSAAVLAYGLSSGERLLLCDPFEGETAYHYERPPTRSAVEHTVSLLSTAGSEGRLEIFEGFSTGLDLVGRSFRFAHIDGSHGESDALADLRLVIDYIIPGGVMVVDDFGHPDWPGVTRAVRTFLSEREDLVNLADANRHAAAGRKLYLMVPIDR
jgi:predicted O-methyltransferase YrrM